MTDRFFGVTWATPEHWYIFIPLLLLCGIVCWWCSRVIDSVNYVAHKDNQALLVKNFSRSNLFLKTALWIVALLSLGIAALRPQWDKKEEKTVHEGRDCIIALDISRSMLAQDIAPSRLARAKEKIQKLVELLQAERVGLLVFSGAAVMQCPLTSDKDAFSMFLDAVSVETISSGTTSYEAALQKVIDVFSVYTPEQMKLAVLVTDGEDFSQHVSALQQKLHDSNIHVCTYAVATDNGAPVPLFDEQGKQRGFQKDGQGNVVISRLNKSLMQQIAQETAGCYVQISEDMRDVEVVKNWVKSFEKSKWEERSVERMHDKYFYYTALAGIALLLEWLL